MIEDSMFFSDRAGRPLPKLPVDANKRVLVADGKSIFSLDQAAAHFQLPSDELRALWCDTFGQILDLDEADTSPSPLERAISRIHAAKESLDDALAELEESQPKGSAGQRLTE